VKLDRQLRGGVFAEVRHEGLHQPVLETVAALGLVMIASNPPRLITLLNANAQWNGCRRAMSSGVSRRFFGLPALPLASSHVACSYSMPSDSNCPSSSRLSSFWARALMAVMPSRWPVRSSA
jgi:hypothetical protein